MFKKCAAGTQALALPQGKNHPARRRSLCNFPSASMSAGYYVNASWAYLQESLPFAHMIEHAAHDELTGEGDHGEAVPHSRRIENESGRPGNLLEIVQHGLTIALNKQFNENTTGN